MEKKKKDKKVASANTREPHSNVFLSKEEENGTKVKNAKISSPSHNNAFPPDQHYPQTLQGPYGSQYYAEQSVLNSRSGAPSQSAPPINLNQWQQAPALQPNANNHPVLQGQPTLRLAQSNTPFWLPQRSGYQVAGVNVPGTFQPFAPAATIDACWQASTVIGGNSLRNQLQVPNLCYHVGYPYSGLPGPWDPTPWAHSQQSQPSCTHSFPGAYGYFSSPSLMKTSQRGIIRPTTKLSQKHQELWEAQSAENVHLWSVIGQLQSEIADHKNRLTKLEAEVASLRPAGNETAHQVTGPALRGQATKRGRPKRSVASGDTLASPDESRPRIRGRKPAACKVQAEARVLECEKFTLNKVEDNHKVGHSSATIRKENGEKKIPNTTTSSGDNLEVNGSSTPTPAFRCQLQEIPRTQIRRVETNSTLEMKINDNKVDDKGSFSIQSQHSEENNLRGAPITHMGMTNNSALGWPASVYPENTRRSSLSMRSQGFYDNGRMTIMRENGWHYVDEEDASDQLEDAVVAAAKNDNHEEMEEDASSGAEENAQRKDEGTCHVDAAVGTNHNDLPQYNNW
ncbi:hypothetical protein SLE2022_364000 [Rubroshorea leprosula]